MAHRAGEPIREQGKVRERQACCFSTVHIEDSASNRSVISRKPVPAQLFEARQKTQQEKLIAHSAALNRQGHRLFIPSGGRARRR
jgi:hypothetical protein